MLADDIKGLAEIISRMKASSDIRYRLTNGAFSSSLTDPDVPISPISIGTLTFLGKVRQYRNDHFLKKEVITDITSLPSDKAVVDALELILRSKFEGTKYKFELPNGRIKISYEDTYQKIREQMNYCRKRFPNADGERYSVIF